MYVFGENVTHPPSNKNIYPCNIETLSNKKSLYFFGRKFPKKKKISQHMLLINMSIIRKSFFWRPLVQKQKKKI